MGFIEMPLLVLLTKHVEHYERQPYAGVSLSKSVKHHLDRDVTDAIRRTSKQTHQYAAEGVGAASRTVSM